MQLELTPEEHNLLAEILEERSRELLREIGRADRRDFRAVLRNKERILQSLLNKLGARAAA